MGVGLNTMLAAVGAGGVAASKVGTAIGNNSSDSSGKDSTVSQANDGELAAKMAEKARKNTLANIKNIMAQKDISEKARSRRIGKALKDLQGGNK